MRPSRSKWFGNDYPQAELTHRPVTNVGPTVRSNQQRANPESTTRQMPHEGSRRDTVDHEHHVERGPESAPKHSWLRSPLRGNVDRHVRGNDALHGYSWRDATAKSAAPAWYGAGDDGAHDRLDALARPRLAARHRNVPRHAAAMATVLALVALGAATVLPWIEQAEGPAMFLGMLGVMLVRPGHNGHAHHHSSGAIGPADPVCGMAIDPTTASRTTEYQGQNYYFCAPGCRKRFLQDPARFLAADYTASM